MNGKKITADVYPGPYLSTWKVRQKWQDWTEIDAFFPMLYTKVFNTPVRWIGKTTAEGTFYLASKKKLLIPGLYIPGMNEVDFRKGVNLVFKYGAYGISVFELGHMNPRYWQILFEEAGPYLLGKSPNATTGIDSLRSKFLAQVPKSSP